MRRNSRQRVIGKRYPGGKGRWRRSQAEQRGELRKGKGEYQGVGVRQFVKVCRDGGSSLAGAGGAEGIWGRGEKKPE